MNLETIDQHQKIERYILNRMDEDEASEFEALYLSDKECLEQLKFAEKLHFGLKFISELEDQITKLPNANIEAKNDSSWWTKKIPMWSAAAVLLVALLPISPVINQLMFEHSSDSNLLVHNLAISNVRSNELDALATSESYIQANTGQTILSVFIDTEIENLTYEKYRFSIHNETEKSSSHKQIDLQLDDNDMLYIDLGKNYLQSGRYKYELAGASNLDAPTTIAAGTLIVDFDID